MSFKIFSILSLLLLFLSSGKIPDQIRELTPEEKKLYNLIMEYRKKNKLKPIPLSPSLSLVASAHVKDLENNTPQNDKCNMHSWSSKGKWSSCCYTADHKEAECMWNKPRELTEYTGNGYEIVFGNGNPEDKTYQATAENAINGWKKSKFHNEVMINKGIWKQVKWNSIGIGIYKGYACAWFGMEQDVIKQ